MQNESLTQGLYRQAKHLGYPDHTIERLSGQKIQEKARPVYKMVDTCAAEFHGRNAVFLCDLR